MRRADSCRFESAPCWKPEMPRLRRHATSLEFRFRRPDRARCMRSLRAYSSAAEPLTFGLAWASSSTMSRFKTSPGARHARNCRMSCSRGGDRRCPGASRHNSSGERPLQARSLMHNALAWCARRWFTRIGCAAGGGYSRLSRARSDAPIARCAAWSAASTRSSPARCCPRAMGSSSGMAKSLCAARSRSIAARSLPP